jgi:CMP/dCMP kinase
MIITIDGYAGSGKSTAAQRLARHLGFQILNTGAMYRAMGFVLVRAGIDVAANPRDVAAIQRIVEAATFEFPNDQVTLNGENLAEEIAREEVGALASKVGTFGEVRAKLKAEQRRLAEGRDVVCEGRDQGTAVFPDAAAKFFLKASADVRADRRVAQLRARNLPADRDVIVRQIHDRDRQDEMRAIDPLRAASDAIVLDTSHLTADDVLDFLVRMVEQCRSKA